MRYIVLAMVLVGCAAPVIPEGATQINPTDVAVAQRAWLAQGLPEPRCAAPLWVEVSLEEFADVCPRPSCAAPGATWEHDGCAHACTVWLDETAPVAYFAGEATSPDVEHESTLEVIAHETYHVWADCTLGGMDEDHTRAPIWTAALTAVRKAAR